METIGKLETQRAEAEVMDEGLDRKGVQDLYKAVIVRIHKVSGSLGVQIGLIIGFRVYIP